MVSRGCTSFVQYKEVIPMIRSMIKKVLRRFPPQIVRIAKMTSSLTENGTLIITGLDSKEGNEDHPMHLSINFSPDDLLNSFGLYQSEERSWLWVKKSMRRK